MPKNSASGQRRRHAPTLYAALLLLLLRRPSRTAMNPTLYKQAMEKAAPNGCSGSSGGAETTPSEQSGSNPHDDADISSVELCVSRGGVVPELRLQGDNVEEGSAATSPATCSPADGERLIENLYIHDEHEKRSSYPTEETLSPFAPGPLTNHWGGRGAQKAGFDRQTSLVSTVGGRSASLGDVWGEGDGEEDLGFGGDPRLQNQLGGVRVLDWDDKLPGETSITQSVRLYLSNLYREASHDQNCALVLHPILVHVAKEELNVQILKTRHTIKIEAFLRSVVLSVPSRTWQESVRGAFARTTPGAVSFSPGHAHQISKEELTFRMTLFVAMMKAERDGTGEADAAVDAARVESVMRGYTANAAEILPLQRPARTLLPPLLFCMACEVLRVRLLAPEVRQVCRQIVSDYEARAKLWMSPLQNAERFLHPLLTEFASWIRANKDILYQGSATEGLLRSIDESLRSSLKKQVYQSPEHFIEVLGSLSETLTNMPLPPYDPSEGDDHPFDVSQTLKDVSRERFDVNTRPTDPSRCWPHIRALLFRAAVQASKSPLDSTERPSDVPVLRSGTGGSRISPDPTSPAAEQKGSKPAALEEADQKCRRPSGAATDDFFPWDAEGRSTGEDHVGKSKSGIVTVEHGAEGSNPKSPLEAYVDQCAWRVLHAASRTASGGDSFFVVQDLFGGEGVLVKMATAPTEPIRIRTKGLSVRVTTIDKHDIYHTSDIDIASGACPRPLITITTVMKEVIQFAPFVKTPSSAESITEGGVLSALDASSAIQQKPSHARSGRFITITAERPREYLNNAAGGLVAPPNAPHSTREHAVRESQPPSVAASTAATSSTVPGRAGASAANSDGVDNGDAFGRAASPEPTAKKHPVRRRPSVFNSPPPSATPASWQPQDNSGSGSSTKSRSSGPSDKESATGTYEKGDAEGGGNAGSA